MKLKVMISQPMRGKTNEQIRKEREEVVKKLEGRGFEVIDTIIAEEPPKDKVEDFLVKGDVQEAYEKDLAKKIDNYQEEPEEDDVFEELISELQKKYPEIYVVKSYKYFCEIANKKATKGNAIKFLANKFGYTEREVLAIGDQNNDIEMVKTAGIGVAMGNGTQEIKKIADYVTDSIQNDGFVQAINKFIWDKENV